jgi:predicted Zn-dependent protease with MMP-like domain
LTDKNDLLGLYRGIPLPMKTASTDSKLPDMIFLYRCPLIKYAKDNEEPIQDLIYHVMIHEIGHHFGHDELDSDWASKV